MLVNIKERMLKKALNKQKAERKGRRRKRMEETEMLAKKMEKRTKERK